MATKITIIGAGSDGVRGKIQNDLNDDELAKLRLSASKLKETIAAINI